MTHRFISSMALLMLLGGPLSAQPCLVIPQTEAEARLLYESGELSSYCYTKIEELFLRPLNIPSDEWSRLSELGVTFFNEELPSLRSLKKYAPYTDSLEALFYQKFPQLAPYRSLIQWPPRFDAKKLAVTSSASFRTSPQTGVFTADVGAEMIIEELFQGDLTIRTHENVVYLYERGLSQKIDTSLRFKLGNSVVERSPLLWGSYEAPKCSTEIGNILWGYKQQWNGIIASYDSKRLGTSFHFHQRYDERLFSGELVIRSPKEGWSVSSSITYEELQTHAVLGQLALSYEPFGVQILCSVDFSGAVAADLSFSHMKSKGGFIGRATILSRLYQAPLSYAVNQLQRVWRGNEIGVGLDIRSFYRIVPHLIARIELFSLITEKHYWSDGTFILYGGEKLRWKSRTRMRLIDTLEGINITEMLALGFVGEKVVPELLCHGEWENGRWEETGVTGATTFHYTTESSVSLSLTGTFREGYQKFLVASSLRQRIGKNHRSALTIEIPITGEWRAMKIYGELFFRW